MGNRGVVSSHWGNMVLVVDEGRLGNMVDHCHRSCVVDLLLLVVVGGDRGGGDDSSLVAGMMMPVADTGERASNAMSGVEVALGADQAGQIGADKQNRLQEILKINSRNPRYYRQLDILQEILETEDISLTHLMTEHGCPSSKLNRLSNEGGGRSLSFYRPQRRSLAGLGDRGKTGWLYTSLDGELRPFPTMSAFWNLGITYMLILRFRKFATQFFFFLRPVCCCRGADSGLCPASPTSA